MKKNRIFNSKGYSLSEVVLSIGIAGIVFWGTTHLFTSYSAKEKETVVEQKWDFHENLHSTVRNGLFNAESETTKRRVNALCKNIKVEPEIPGLAKVLFNANLTKAIGSIKWNNILPSGWVQKKCTLDPSNSSFTNKICFKSTDPNLGMVRVKVSSIDLSKWGSGSFSPVKKPNNGDKDLYLDVKQIGIRVKVESISSAQVLFTSQSFYSAVHLNFCHLVGKTPGTPEYEYQVFLSPSATGSKDVGQSLYNSKTIVSSQPLKISLQNSAGTQAGKFLGGYIITDSSFNRPLLCTENKYRCRKKSSTPRSFDDEVNIELFAEYQRTSSFPASAQSKFSMYFKEQGLASKYLPASVMNSADGSAFDKVDLATGTQGFNLKFKLPNGSGLCHKVCDSVPAPDIRLHVDAKLNAVGNSQVFHTEKYVSDVNVGCTVCYMKNCKRYGIGTFGPLEPGPASPIGQPDEPLDANIPECVVEDDPADLQDMKPYSDSQDPKKYCIAGNLKDGQLRLKSMSCSDSLPVMCFKSGGFKLAKNITTGGLLNVSHYKASQACFKQSKEVLKKPPIHQLFSSFGISFLISGFYVSDLDRLDYYNVAEQGIFLAPQTTSQIEQARYNVGSNIDKWFWINLKADSAKRTLSGPLEVVNDDGFSDMQSAFYFNKEGLPTQKRVFSTYQGLGIDLSGSVRSINGSFRTIKVGMLVHNIAHKGLYRVNKEQDDKYHFLCKRRVAPFDYFISSGNDENYRQGSEKCKDDGGYFYPPVTPLQWVKALHLVQKNEKEQPFPLKSGPGVWVALEFIGNKISMIEGLYVFHERFKGVFPFQAIDSVDKFGVVKERTVKSASQVVEVNKSPYQMRKDLHCAHIKNGTIGYKAPAEFSGESCP